MKKLVAYFSPTGTTKRLAEKLAEVIGADLFEIKPEIKYTDADLDWRNELSRSSVEMKDSASRPAIAEKLAGMDGYDTVFIGFPIWWYVAPTIINTFIESYDFSGKTVVPFATSGSSGMGNTVEVLSSLCDSTVKWASGKVMKAGISESELLAWTAEIQK